MLKSDIHSLKYRIISGAISGILGGILGFFAVMFINPETAPLYVVLGGLLLIVIAASVIWLPYLIVYEIIAKNERLKNLYFKFCKIKTDKNANIKLTFFSAIVMDDALKYLQKYPNSDILRLASFLKEKYSIPEESFCLIIKKLKDDGYIAMNY